MCGCVEKMPIVTRSDCTEIDALEFWKFEWKAESGFVATLDRAEITFKACQGKHGNNDLERFYERLRIEGRASFEDREKLRRTVVRDNVCHEAREAMMFDKGFEVAYPPVPIETVDGTKLFSIKVEGGVQNTFYLYTDPAGDVRLTGVSVANELKAQWRFLSLNGDENSLFNIRPNSEAEQANGGTLQGDELFLGSDFHGRVQMEAQDKKTGREMWYLKKIRGTENTYNIMISGGTRFARQFLSARTDGNLEMARLDDRSGRQRWVIDAL